MIGFDHLTIVLLSFILAYAGAVTLLCWWHLTTERRIAWPLMLLAVYGPAAAGTAFLGGTAWATVPVLALGALAASLARRRLGSFTGPGVLMIVASLQLLLAGLAWSARFMATIPVSSLTRGLLFAGLLVGMFLLPVGLVHAFEGSEVLWRKTWRRPRTALPGTPRRRYPKVSVHVPVHAEPPEVVIATLDALANLRYPNLEVLVIDNNTADPRLWEPVEAHCRDLGPRYRFFHVEGLAGAKAGALNLALRHTAPDAELVSVVDADYQVDPAFLERLVGYFDDPAMGFVQTPHDYRGWEERTYLRACHWEYRYFFRTTLVSRNERTAAITVGTMCLIRRRALEEAGGWAEWCVTEDSELAIRIHALGYSSVYLSESFGRGLIPETFLGYKRQRFRWTYGPVQELKRHWRLLLPRPFARPSRLSPAQKIHHLTHGLDRLAVGLGFLLIPVGLGVVASMLAHGEVVQVPLALWLALVVVLVAGLVLRWLLYRVVIGSSVRDTLKATLASKALAHTVTMASVYGLFTRTMPWRRTDKFRAEPSALRALRSARAETSLGLASAALAVLVIGAQPRAGLLFMLCIGALLRSVRYMAAPAVALLAERDLRRASAVSGERKGSERARWLEPAMGRSRFGLAKAAAAVGIAAAIAAVGIVFVTRIGSYTEAPGRLAIAPEAPRRQVSAPASHALSQEKPVGGTTPLATSVGSDASAQTGGEGTGAGDGGGGPGPGSSSGEEGSTDVGGDVGGGSTVGSEGGGGSGGPDATGESGDPTSGSGSGGGSTPAGAGGGSGVPEAGGSGEGGSTAGWGGGGGSGAPDGGSGSGRPMEAGPPAAP